jgi:AcrR family transcriptional regulator
MSDNTREQFLTVAARLFAERGFYGASIAAIANELALTKQALLHHFGSKEKLYGEILKAISDKTLARLEAIQASTDDPAEQLEEVIVEHFREQMAEQDAARLLMRELLDNERRAERAGNWYLKPYLNSLVDTVAAIDESLDRPEALALAYQLLGAANYIALSQPTLTQIFGKSQFRDTRRVFEAQLRQLIRARLGAGAINQFS